MRFRWFIFAFCLLLLQYCAGVNIVTKNVTKPVYLNGEKLPQPCKFDEKNPKSKRFGAEVEYGSNQANNHGMSNEQFKTHNEREIEIQITSNDPQDTELTAIEEFHFGSKGWFYLLLSGHRNWGEYEMVQCKAK